MKMLISENEKDLILPMVKEEKYHGPLMCRVGKKKGKERENLVLLIAQYDIFLATKSINVRCRVETIFEDKLAEISIENVKSIDRIKSVKGLKSLILLKRFSLAISVFDESDNKNLSELRSIITKLVNDDKENTFFIIRQLLKYQKYKLLTSAILNIISSKKINDYLDMHGESEFETLFQDLSNHQNFEGKSICLCKLAAIVKCKIDDEKCRYLIEDKCLGVDKNGIPFNDHKTAWRIIINQNLEEKYNISSLVDSALNSKKKDSLLFVGEIVNDKTIDQSIRIKIKSELLNTLSKMMNCHVNYNNKSDKNEILTAINVVSKLNYWRDWNFDFLSTIFILTTLNRKGFYNVACDIIQANDFKLRDLFRDYNLITLNKESVCIQCRLDLFCFLHANQFPFSDAYTFSEFIVHEMTQDFIRVQEIDGDANFHISKNNIPKCFTNFRRIKFYGSHISTGKKILAKIERQSKNPNIKPILVLNF
jgi:hypothetical protein